MIQAASDSNTKDVIASNNPELTSGSSGPKPGLERHLVLAGDVTVQRHLAEVALLEKDGQDSELSPELEITTQNGGIVFLQRLIYSFLELEFEEPPLITHSGITTEYHQWKISSKESKPEIQTYSRFLGYCHPESGAGVSAWYPERYPGKIFSIPQDDPANIPHKSVLVLDDCNIQFRECEQKWPAQLKHLSSDAEMVLLKTTYPFDDSRNQLFSHCVQYCAEKLIVVFSAEDLRKMDIQLTKNLSWEEALDDLIFALRSDFKLAHLRRCRWLVISFGVSGTVLVQNPSAHPGQSRVFRIIDPRYMSPGTRNSIESARLAELHCSWITAAIASYFARCENLSDFLNGAIIPNAGKKGSSPQAFDSCLKRAMDHIRRWSDNFTKSSSSSGLRKLLLLDKDLSRDDSSGNLGDKNVGTDEGKKTSTSFNIFKIEDPFTNVDSDEGPISVSSLNTRQYTFELECEGKLKDWTFLPKDEDAVKRLARLIATEGPEKALVRYPYEKFSKKLLTADRVEIDRFRVIRRLFQEYQQVLSPPRPLCIVVFGKPGTGKSFVVKEIAGTVLRESVEFLTFNLSQLSKPEDLIGAFHQVRDSVLRGKTPVVFWDEFDCSLNGVELGWLRYFLAPMQDGEFQEDQITHSIGKAIFVFAGGTNESWMDFVCKDPAKWNFEETPAKSMLSYASNGDEGSQAPSKIPAKEKDLAEWKSSKAPDFMSRLQGHLDILNPNGAASQMGQDYVPIKAKTESFTHYIRRAFLLRHMLHQRERKLFNGNRLQIEYEVLDELLFRKEYEHGARSIEAILMMSQLIGNTTFTRSDLPSREQMEMHVADSNTEHSIQIIPGE